MQTQVLADVRALEPRAPRDLGDVSVRRLVELREVGALELVERVALRVVVRADSARLDDVAFRLRRLQPHRGCDVERLARLGERE
jgi:hypothetical protein